LKRPSWPSPYPYKEFVKGSGQIIERRNGGLDNWIGENYICQIKKGIKFSNFNFKNPNGDHIKIKNISKHQYTTEEGILTKYVFVFKIIGINTNTIDVNIINNIIDNILNNSVSVRSFDFKYKKTHFINFVNNLRNFHILTTTKNNGFMIEGAFDKIKFCTPQFYFLLDSHESFTSKNKQTKHFTKNQHLPFELFSYWGKYNNRPYKIWIHQKNTTSSLLELNRKFRISLLRLHSEFESLNFVLTAINDGELIVKEMSNLSDILQNYISNSISSILKQKDKVEANIGAQNSLEYFKEILYQSQPGDYDILIRRLKKFDFRPQVESKTLLFIENYNSLNLNVMENKYKIDNSQVGAIGDHSTSDHNTFQQINYTIPNNLDYPSLVVELGKLKESLRLEAEEVEQFDALKNITQAEIEAKKGNGKAVVGLLKSGGKWILDVATRIGVNIVTGLLENNITI
jgi:hypothetical protein